MKIEYETNALRFSLYSAAARRPPRSFSLPTESISIPLNFVSGVLQIFAPVCTEMERGAPPLVEEEEGRKEYTYPTPQSTATAAAAATSSYFAASRLWHFAFYFN